MNSFLFGSTRELFLSFCNNSSVCDEIFVCEDSFTLRIDALERHQPLTPSLLAIVAQQCDKVWQKRRKQCFDDTLLQQDPVLMRIERLLRSATSTSSSTSVVDRQCFHLAISAALDGATRSLYCEKKNEPKAPPKLRHALAEMPNVRVTFYSSVCLFSLSLIQIHFNRMSCFNVLFYCLALMAVCIGEELFGTGFFRFTTHKLPTVDCHR